MPDSTRATLGTATDVALGDVPLAPLTTLGVGGTARWYYRATTPESAADALRWAAERGIEVFVLGGGSNLVVADRGWPGLVLHVGVAGLTSVATAAGVRIAAGAGESWDTFVAGVVAQGLCGVECLSGIPGTVGGTPVQNVGAYGQEVAGVIASVTAIDRSSATIVELHGSDCGFAYRMSRFKGTDANRFLICTVTFELSPGVPTATYPDVIEYLGQHAIMAPAVQDVRDAVLAIRRRKGMVLDESDPDTRSVGSFFMNPTLDADTFQRLGIQSGRAVPGYPRRDGSVKIPAAWLIERAGFARGFAMGAAGVSSKHPLALVNRGGASAREVVALAGHIKREVARQFGVWLLPEPVFVGFGDDPNVAFLTTAGHGAPEA